MRFFTQQFNEQTRVWHFLNFVDGIKEFEISDDMAEYHISQGKDPLTDMKRMYWEMYNNVKPYLLKYLPKYLKSTIYDCFPTYGKLPNKRLQRELKKYQEYLGDLVHNDSDINVWKAYSSYYKEIEKLLPQSMINLNQKYNFHDTQICCFEFIDKDKIIIKLNCKGSFLKSDGTAFLTFSNVKFSELSDSCIGNWWRTDETHLSDIGGFDFQVLLNNSQADERKWLNEFRIIADEVSLSFSDSNS